jgi:RNA polymerase sigma factor (sigma-70 family)
MPDANDMDLVREFARNHSEAAFTELVRRHLNLVYSVARRCTGSDSDAQDVTQAAFVILARKAAGLRTRTVLTGWLYETTRHTAACLQRTNARRHAREQEAYMQSTLTAADTADAWSRLAPHLEAAMAQLGERDRTLLALRFYENKTGPEAAVLLGIREAAAHKRTARALEKLRIFFSHRGVALSAAAIAGAVSANSVQVAPAALAKTISAVAMAKGMSAGASTLTLVKGALKIMAWTKMKMVIAVGATVILMGSATAYDLTKWHDEEKLSAIIYISDKYPVPKQQTFLSIKNSEVVFIKTPSGAKAVIQFNDYGPSKASYRWRFHAAQSQSIQSGRGQVQELYGIKKQLTNGTEEIISVGRNNTTMQVGDFRIEWSSGGYGKGFSYPHGESFLYYCPYRATVQVLSSNAFDKEF